MNDKSKLGGYNIVKWSVVSYDASEVYQFQSNYNNNK